MIRGFALRCLAAVSALFMLLFACAPAMAGAEPERLHPGDVLQVVMPGEAAFSKPFDVGRDGRIDLPEAGPIAVAGLTLGEASARVRAALAVSYRDMAHFALLLKQRRLLLTVLGYVKRPGMVELPAGGNVQMALDAAGGLTQGAQLDRIQVRRGGHSITFNYKRYLDSGDPRVLPRLQPLDEIFVPASPLTGNVQINFDARTLAAAGDAAEARTAVRVFGEVNSPGNFAFHPGITAVDALLRAGGVTRFAGVTEIRIISGSTPQLFNLKAYLDSGNQAMNPALQPGTIIFVPRATEEVNAGPHVVYVMGEVAKPGAYEVRKGTNFLDVLANAGGPTRFADTRNIRVLRAAGGVEPFDLSAYTEHGGQARLPPVQPGDAVFVPEKTQSPEQSSWLRTPTQRAVRVIGAVKAPGRYEWSDDMSLLDLMAQAGGPTSHGNLEDVEILTGDAGGHSVHFNLQHFLNHGGSAGSLPTIHGGYTVMVPEMPQSPTDMRSQWIKQPAADSIYVMGSVGRPGRYAFAPGLSFLDILSAADGPTPSADILNIRVAHRGEGRDYVSKVDLAAYFRTGDDSLLPHVKPGDVIFVPDRNRNWLEESPSTTVRVLGSVGKPGRYRFDDNMTLLDLLAEAGGPTKDAMQTKIVVVNLSCCGNHAELFNLVKFARSGDYAKLPVLRAGDTVYVPSTDQSDWKIFMNNIHDSISVLSIFALLKVLL